MPDFQALFNLFFAVKMTAFLCWHSFCNFLVKKGLNLQIDTKKYGR